MSMIDDGEERLVRMVSNQSTKGSIRWWWHGRVDDINWTGTHTYTRQQRRWNPSKDGEDNEDNKRRFPGKGNPDQQLGIVADFALLT